MCSSDLIKESGRNHALIVVSEGVKREDGQHVSAATNKIGETVYGGIGQYLSAELNKRYKEFQTRVTTLGHVQRSGDPLPTDRILATMFGAKAVALLEEGKTNRMVVWKNHRIEDYDIDEVVKEGTTLLDVSSDYVKTARAVGMYVGEE